MFNILHIFHQHYILLNTYSSFPIFKAIFFSKQPIFKSIHSCQIFSLYLRSVLLVSLVLVSVTAEISDNQVDTEYTDTGGSSLQKRTGGHHHGTGQTSNIIIICYGLWTVLLKTKEKIITTEKSLLGTSCVVKGSYCQCHYCKCERGQLHCSKKGFGGHKVKYGSISSLLITKG